MFRYDRYIDLEKGVIHISKNMLNKHCEYCIIIQSYFIYNTGIPNYFADRVMFIDKGLILEQGNPEEIFRNLQHERTKSFLSKVI